MLRLTSFCFYGTCDFWHVLNISTSHMNRKWWYWRSEFQITFWGLQRCFSFSPSCSPARQHAKVVGASWLHYVLMSAIYFITLHMRNQQTYCNTRLVLLRLGLAEGCATFITDRGRPYTDTTILHELPLNLRTQKPSHPVGNNPNLRMAWKWTSNCVRYSSHLWIYIYEWSCMHAHFGSETLVSMQIETGQWGSQEAR